MSPYIAIHKIRRNPTGTTRYTGEYNEDGEPIIRASSEIVDPGTVFYPKDDEERDYLIAIGGARAMSEQELSMYEIGVTSGFPKYAS